METQTKVIIGAVGLVTLGAVILAKKAGDAGGAGLGAAAAGAVVDAVGGAATGTVIAIGKQVGIPETSMSACEQAKAEGRAWDASFACPASDFMAWVLSGKPSTLDHSKIDIELPPANTKPAASNWPDAGPDGAGMWG